MPISDEHQQTTGVDTRDMVVVHTALLREFRLAPGLVRAVRPGERRRARRVAAHLTFLTGLLHHHHSGEDALLWPKLRERMPAELSPLLDQMHAQHEDINTLITRVRDMVPPWRRNAGPAADRDRLADDLGELHASLTEHLDAEERDLLPLAARSLTRSEWRHIGEAAAASIAKPKLALVFGLFAYEADPDVVRDMLASAPALPRLLLPRVAPRSYRRYAQRLYDTSTP